MKQGSSGVVVFALMAFWAAIALGSLAFDRWQPGFLPFSSGLTLPLLVALVAGIWAVCHALRLASRWALARRNKPPVEAEMIGRVYKLISLLLMVLALAYGFGALATVGNFFALFGGMLLGWSLQAPVSGVAAWLLLSIKRPFRPGDRVQFPNLGLTGDVKDIGVMYTVLDQVGGSVGSEEAVGRDILVPNAMLFSQVAINYTVTQEAAYMLDEIVVRITYDSDWEEAEKILLNAAQEVTGEIIAATKSRPYIRSDLYDYGVYLRLRYQTRVKDRAEIAYRLNKGVFEEIQKTPKVDLAIPFVYSYRKGVAPAPVPVPVPKEAAVLPKDREAENIQEVEIERVRSSGPTPDTQDLDQLARSIDEQGLLQPIVLVKHPQSGLFDVLAGHMRFEACRKLGWRTIPAVVHDSRPAGKSGVRPAATGTQV